MTWLWIIITILLAAAGAALAWRMIVLQRRIAQYTGVLQEVIEAKKAITDLPEDVVGLAALSNAVKTLMLSLRLETEAAEGERSRLAAVLDQMTDGVIIADAEGKVRFVNPAVERLFETKETVGRTVAEVFRQHQLIEAWQRGRETGEIQHESVERQGRRQFLQLIAIPDKMSGESLLMVQDLTQVRRLETVRRDFISNLSHELRTPLASLKALTETLQEGAMQDPNAAPRFLKRIETEVDALTQMATELLELSRIESGQVPLELRAVPAVSLLSSAVDRMRAQAERAGLALHLEEPLDTSLVKADPPRLEQVLVNLIHNAVKFSNPGGVVSLSVKREGNYVCFSVKDNGTGIPAEDVERIFERFYKADRARSSRGTGLGLSISRHLVEAHGGRIWAESVEGRGSTFYFTLPVSV